MITYLFSNKVLDKVIHLGTNVHLHFDIHSTLTLGGGGGGGVSELTDRQGCAILALKVVPKNLIFA